MQLSECICNPGLLFWWDFAIQDLDLGQQFFQYVGQFRVNGCNVKNSLKFCIFNRMTAHDGLVVYVSTAITNLVEPARDVVAT